MSIFDLSGIVSGWSNQTVTVRRYTATFSQATGKYTKSNADTTISAHIQPVTGRELDTLKELENVRHALKLWTTVPLYGIRGELLPADDVLVNGDTYKVRQQSNWQPNGNYYETVVVIYGPN